jgi:hypothetical protein
VVRNTCRFLEWISEKSACRLVAQVKEEILMLVHETADGFGTITHIQVHSRRRAVCVFTAVNVPFVAKL